MSNIKNEVIQRLRSDIRTKLDEIGAFVDNELADYIMVLVANQKTKYQMKDDLSLFLGAETDEFVNWLHNTLKQIQLNATEGEDKKVVTTAKTESNELPQNPNPIPTKTKTKNKKVDKHLAKSEKIEEKSKVSEITEDKSETIVDKDSDESKLKSESTKQSLKVVNAVSPQLKSQTNNGIESENNLSEEQNEKKEKSDNPREQSDGEVVLHLNPDGGDVDELLQENDINDEKKTEVKVVSNETKVESIKSAKVVPLRRQPMTTTPNSTIGSFVRNKFKPLDNEGEEEEEEEELNRPVVGSVASVVRVTQRKPSVPLELQANKMLLLRAVKDAHESTLPNRKRANDEVNYTPTPIKKRLGERQEVVISESVEQDLDPEDLRNYLNVNKKDSDKSEELDESVNNNRIVKQIQYKENKEIDPQFVVTLDGVDPNKYSQNTDFDESLMLSESMDELDMELNEDIDMKGSGDEDLENDYINDSKVNERCRFWPTCKNGDECEFQHPTTPCKTFPNCRFGDKCLYVHPNCKFDAMCSRRDCPFTHASKRKLPTSKTISNILPPVSAKQCKYVPNCKNPSCPYFHPKICHFGMKCRSHNCPFIHPNMSYSTMASVPHPHQLKWKAKNHISERQFANTTTNDSKTSTTTDDLTTV